jgi:hypothetical protein
MASNEGGESKETVLKEDEKLLRGWLEGNR